MLHEEKQTKAAQRVRAFFPWTLPDCGVWLVVAKCVNGMKVKSWEPTFETPITGESLDLVTALTTTSMFLYQVFHSGAD